MLEFRHHGDGSTLPAVTRPRWGSLRIGVTRERGLPTLVIIDKAGIVRHVQLGAGNFAAVEAAIVRLL